MSAIEITDQLRAHAPRAPESLRARVHALEPAPRRARRRVLLVALAAGVLAVGSAVAHGIAGSGSPSATPTKQPLELARPQRAAGAGGSVAHGAVVPTWTIADSAQAQALPPSVPGGRLQHTDASLRVRVADVQQLSRATSAATRIAASLGGYAQSVVYRTPQGGGGASYIELRVPVQNVQAAIARLGALGTILAQQLSVQDLQHDFEIENAQIAQLRRTVAALQSALRNPALPDGQRVLLQIRLAEAKRALSQRLHARSGTIAAGTTARISLVLETREAVVAPPPHRGRLGRMLHSALGFLGLEGTVALYALIVLSPVGLLAALVWGLGRAWRRRAEERLLAA